MEIGSKETALVKLITFVVAKIHLCGGGMKVATINIRTVKIHTQEPFLTTTYGDGEERDTYAITNTTGDTTITDPVSVQVLRRQHQTI